MAVLSAVSSSERKTEKEVGLTEFCLVTWERDGEVDETLDFDSS